jgi:gluconate 5-dehydrogenase
MQNNFIQSIFSLEKKVAIVSGAVGFFGKTFSECLLLAGAKVILLGRGTKIKELSESLKGKFEGDRIDYYQIDFFDDDNFRKCLTDIINKNSTVDILVNNAFEFSKETGFNDPSGKLESISKNQWMRSFESGVYWHALAIQVVGEKMKAQRSGSIINISSMYGLISPDPELYQEVEVFNPPSYGVAKAAILALTRYTASFWGEYNIRCNSIVPGAFPNEDPTAYNAPKDKGFLKRLTDRTALKRTGRLEDLKGVLIFLASDASSYITGQAIVIDGGWTIR